MILFEKKTSHSDLLQVQGFVCGKKTQKTFLPNCFKKFVVIILGQTILQYIITKINNYNVYLFILTFSH